MKKKKGFIFVETILVTAVLLSSLMLIYSLFVASNNSETRRLRYDDPAKLYETAYIKKYLESFELDDLKEKITDSSPVQIIYRSQSELFGSAFNAEKSFFENLWANLHIQSIMLMPYDVSVVLECNQGASSVCTNENLVTYLKTLDTKDNTGYRLVIEYQTNLAGDSCTKNSDCFSFFSNVRVGAKNE